MTISQTQALHIGGDSTECYIYDDLSQTFTEVPSPTHSKQSASAGKVTLTNGREVVIAAGYRGNGDVVEIFDIKTKVWTEKPEWKLPLGFYRGKGHYVGNRLANAFPNYEHSTMLQI